MRYLCPDIVQKNAAISNINKKRRLDYYAFYEQHFELLYCSEMSLENFYQSIFLTCVHQTSLQVILRLPSLLSLLSLLSLTLKAWSAMVSNMAGKCHRNGGFNGKNHL